MGKILYFECNKHKEHNHEFFIGIGMLFPEQYDKIIKQIKKGKYGKEIKKFLEENPDGAINCNTEIAQCPKCGKLKEVPNLSMYVPKDNNEKADKSYVMSWELKEKYKKVKEYKHVCPKCSSEMKIIKIEYDEYGDIVKIGKIKCPECDGSVEWNGDCGCWD